MRVRHGLVLLLVVSLAGCKIGPTSSVSPSASTVPATQTPRTGTPTGSGFQVTGSVVRADPFQVTTTCPATITFSARISVAGGSGLVTYRWLRSDGSQGSPQTIRFDRTSSQDVTTTWTLPGSPSPGSKYTGWQELEIVRPNHQVSERASFTLTCLGVPG